jgi:preprotein translocase subunit SecG
VSTHGKKRFRIFSSRARTEEESVGKLNSQVTRKATLLALIFFLLTTITFGVMWFKEYSSRHREEKVLSEEETARKAAFVAWKNEMAKQLRDQMDEINRRSERELEGIVEKGNQKQ